MAEKIEVLLIIREATRAEAFKEVGEELEKWWTGVDDWKGLHKIVEALKSGKLEKGRQPADIERRMQDEVG